MGRVWALHTQACQQLCRRSWSKQHSVFSAIMVEAPEGKKWCCCSWMAPCHRLFRAYEKKKTPLAVISTLNAGLVFASILSCAREGDLLAKAPRLRSVHNGEHQLHVVGTRTCACHVRDSFAIG